MKQPLNEQFRRMQKLAGVITENIENIKEDESSPYYKLGYQIGPNGRRATVDTQSTEYNTIEEKANQLTSLLNDKDLIDFAKGSTDSIGSSRARYEGLQDVASSLLFFNEIKNRLGESKLNKNQIQEMDMDVKTILDNNGIDDDYFESMGEKAIETGTEEWLDILSDVTGKDAYTAEFDKEDEAKIQVFMQKLETLGIELI
jgi:hypothetical protein